MIRFLFLLIACCLLLSCRGDATITRGADGSPEWDRKLRAAVPLGSPTQETRGIMQRNGFHCEPGADPVTTLWCRKEADAPLGLGRRRWQATFLIRDGHVDEIRSSTRRLNR
ncbi:MAG TPA: hypothetical protein VGR38_11675 [Candidatus Polarisedimenticolia bacterium]|jgi:hypothetical protein|nr:hypothetical protein [Candidatus Polarisedimenticolia bacterium]